MCPPYWTVTLPSGAGAERVPVAVTAPLRPRRPGSPGPDRPRPASPPPGARRDSAPLPPTSSSSSPALPPPVPGCQHHESGRRQARSEAPEEQAGRRPRQHRRAGTQRRYRRAGQGRGCGGSGPRPAGRGGRPADSSGRRQRSPGRRRGRGGTRRGERGRAGRGDIPRAPGAGGGSGPGPARGWARRCGQGAAGPGSSSAPTLCGGRAAGPCPPGVCPAVGSGPHPRGLTLMEELGETGLGKAERHLHYALFAVANFVIRHRRFIVARTVVGTLVPWDNSDLLDYFILR